MRKLNIAVVGIGYWGKNLVRNFFELGVLDTICDNDTQLLQQRQEEYKIPHTTQNYNDVLKNNDIDAIVLATPAVKHYEMVKAALLAGKDVFVEKPLALQLDQAQELAELAKTTNRILMVDHILKYHPAVIKLKELIDQGALGKLQYIYSNRLNIGKLRQEENILWSFAPHDISVILHLANETPHSIHAHGGAYLQENVYDTTMTLLSFSNSLKAHIFVSWLHPYKVQRFVVVGDKNMAVFNDLETEKKLVLFPHKVQWIQRIPVAAKAECEIISLEAKEPLREACLHFLNCVEDRRTPHTDANEACAVLKILQDAQACLDKGYVTQ